ncbi:hypothetical protein SKAU_G00231020 [Synaphobranchus kaupii]|uniref:Uncharacterized protein n=1 Tax=Synaphobranchus kaupii TaxID=118154 RepID=A0A9Q1ITC4_SYNKA|nr:hypothetical protein SKAU_G00231020 [Synaphobranchus kaupii]
MTPAPVIITGPPRRPMRGRGSAALRQPGASADSPYPSRVAAHPHTGSPPSSEQAAKSAPAATNQRAPFSSLSASGYQGPWTAVCTGVCLNMPKMVAASKP